MTKRKIQRYWVEYEDVDYSAGPRFWFATEAERTAFMEGVDWVNDSSIRLVGTGEE